MKDDTKISFGEALVKTQLENPDLFREYLLLETKTTKKAARRAQGRLVKTEYKDDWAKHKTIPRAELIRIYGKERFFKAMNAGYLPPADIPPKKGPHPEEASWTYEYLRSWGMAKAELEFTRRQIDFAEKTAREIFKETGKGEYLYQLIRMLNMVSFKIWELYARSSKSAKRIRLAYKY